MSDADSPHEAGVCVACKAAADTVFDPDGCKIPCCTECKEDGSFTQWLTDELERLAPEMGLVACGKNEQGHTLWRSRKP